MSLSRRYTLTRDQLMLVLLLITGVLGGLLGNALSCRLGTGCFALGGDYSANADYLRLLSGFLAGVAVGAFGGLRIYALRRRTPGSFRHLLLGTLMGLLLGLSIDYALLILKVQLKAEFHLPHETLPDWVENVAFASVPLATIVLGTAWGYRRQMRVERGRRQSPV